MRIFDKRTLLFVCALAATPVAWSAGPGTYLGMGANPGPGASATTQLSGGASIGANQPVPSPNSRALEQANGQFADRQLGLERAQDRMSVQGAEQQRASEELEQRARRSGLARAPGPLSTPASPAAAAESATGAVTQ